MCWLPSSTVATVPLLPEGRVMDKTREIAMFLQQGVRNAKAWRWGPLIVGRMEHPSCVTYNIEITLGFCGISLSFWRLV